MEDILWQSRLWKRLGAKGARSNNPVKDKSTTRPPKQSNCAASKKRSRNEIGGALEHFSVNTISFPASNWLICLESESVSWALNRTRFSKHYTSAQNFPGNISELTKVFSNFFAVALQQFTHLLVFTVFLMRCSAKTSTNTVSQGLAQPWVSKD